MRGVSLKTKVATFTAILAVISLAAGALVLLSVVRFRQVQELDEKVAEEVEELFRDLSGFSGAPIDAAHPISARFVPLALRERKMILLDSVGREFYRSPELGEIKLEAGDEEGGSERVVGGENCRIYHIEKGRFRVVVAASLAEVESFQADLRKDLWIAMAAVGPVVFFGGFFLAGRAISPVRKLTEAAEGISADHPEELLPVPRSGDEIARLSEVLNRAFSRLQTSYAAATRFSADASHQLKTPVAVLRAGLEEWRETQSGGDEDQERIDALLGQTRRLTSLIEDLLLLAQADAGRLALQAEEVDVSHLVASALDDLEVLVDGATKVESEVPGEVRLFGDARWLGIILQNLVENAAKYVSGEKVIRVVLDREDGGVGIRVMNTGRPIPEGEREKIFERFRRGAGLGENVRGHGLGLNIARELARAHGGDLVLSRSDEEWTEFLLTMKEIPSTSA